MGARLPARLLPARRRRALARGQVDRGLDGDRDAAGGGGHRDPARAARPGAGGDRVRPPQPLLRGRPVRDQGGRPPRDRPGPGRSGGAARDRLRGHAQRVRQARHPAGPRARRAGGDLPRRPRARAARRGAAALHVRRVAGGGGDQRVRHGRRQGRRAHGLPRERPGLARGLLPGGRPRGARRQARPLPAVRLQPRQGPARVLHRALDGRRGGDRDGRQAADRPRGRRALRRRAAGAARRSRAAPRTMRCARSSATSRARASSSRRRRRRTSWSAASPASGTVARSRSAAPPRARGRRRAGASTARCGRGSRARAAAGSGILRHFGDLSDAPGRGPVLRRLRPLARARAAQGAQPGGAPRPARPARAAARRAT